MLNFVVPTVIVLLVVSVGISLTNLLDDSDRRLPLPLRPRRKVVEPARKVAVTADEVALFVHDVEVGANVALAVTAKREVYVNRRQLGRIRRYLSETLLPGAAPELVFREYGYELVLTRSR